MANPWLKKNPFMSMWLSGANAVAGSLRGQAVAQGKRNATVAASKVARDVIDVWSGASLAPAAKKKRRPRSRR